MQQCVIIPNNEQVQRYYHIPLLQIGLANFERCSSQRSFENFRVS